MANDKKEITLSNTALQMAPLKEMKAWYDNFVKFSQEILKKDLDYGIIPGVSKPSLLKPGAEKLRFVYGLTTETECTDKSIDLSQTPAYIDYTYKTTVKTKDGQVLATCEGNANSYEPKFAYVWVRENDIPSGVKKETLKTKGGVVSEFAFAIDKAETTGQYGKPQEYWDKWKKAIENGVAEKINKETRNGKQMEAYQMSDLLYRVPNEDVLGLKNTIMKMSQKRSFVGAMLIATGASEFYTQDVEDMELINTDDPIVVKPAEKKEEIKVEEGQVVDTSPITAGQKTLIIQLIKNKKVEMTKEKFESLTFDEARKIIQDYGKNK